MHALLAPLAPRRIDARIDMQQSVRYATALTRSTSNNVHCSVFVATKG